MAVELRWLPGIARQLALPVPVPVRKGVPGCGYPWNWSVCSWLPGDAMLVCPPDDRERFAAALGAFTLQLHQPAPAHAPRNLWRATPLAARDADVRERVAALGPELDSARVLSRWGELAGAPLWEGPPVWVHGDLHPANILVADGELSAVIDWGDLSAGDPAVDFVMGWMALTPGERAILRAAAGDVDNATWERARGWALVMALALLANSADNPAYQALGTRTLTAVLDH